MLRVKEGGQSRDALKELPLPHPFFIKKGADFTFAAPATPSFIKEGADLAQKLDSYDHICLPFDVSNRVTGTNRCTYAVGGFTSE